MFQEVQGVLGRSDQARIYLNQGWMFCRCSRGSSRDFGGRRMALAASVIYWETKEKQKKHFFFLFFCVSRKFLNVSPMPLGYVVSLESRELLLRMMAEYPPLTSIGILLLFLGGGGPVCLALVTNERENHAK